jgi:hypothetical protein
MSLTGHLRHSGSPVRAWFAQNFSDTRGLATATNRTLSAGLAECRLPPPSGSDGSLVGTAVDLLRVHLDADALDRTVARNAARFLGSVATRALELEREAATMVTILRPWERELSDADWRQLCLACVALARFEQWYRAGPPVGSYIREPLLRVADHDGVDALRATVGEPTLNDLNALGRAALEDHAGLP